MRWLTIEVGTTAASNNVRTGDLDDEIRVWRPALAEEQQVIQRGSRPGPELPGTYQSRRAWTDDDGRLGPIQVDVLADIDASWSAAPSPSAM